MSTNSALVLSIAYGISVMLTNAGVLDTIVYWASKPLVGMSKGVSVIAIIIVVTFINFFIKEDCYESTDNTTITIH